MTDTPILANLLEEMMAAGRMALGMNMRLPRSGDTPLARVRSVAVRLRTRRPRC